MFNFIIEWSLKNRWLVCLIAIFLLFIGMHTTSKMPIDVFPDFAPVQVVVQTEAKGYAPEEVESVITLPVETAINGVPSVKISRSVSTIGLSVITLIFEDGTDIFKARQLVSERLQSVKLPVGIESPKLTPITTSVGEIALLGFTAGKKTTPLELGTLADWVVRPRVMAIPGISNVVKHGGDVRQYQVLVDPDKLQAYGITLEQVTQAATESNKNASGGILRTQTQEYLIRGIGRVQSVEEIGQQIIKNNEGIPITIEQVAQVQVGPAFRTSNALINGKEGVILSIFKQPWANTLETTYALENTIQDLKKAFPSDVKAITIFRQADFIEVAIHNVLEALVLGGVLVIIIVFAFLQNWRTALITLTAIPLSLLTAMLALKWQGGIINTMTLGGLAIAIGEVVDDAIIDVENVYKRLRENQLLGLKQPILNVIFEASKEIRSSVVYATWIVILVFLPVFSLGGLEGKIFTPLAFSYIVAILASLFVALTVTPALCYLLLGKQTEFPHQEPRLLAWLKYHYSRALYYSLSQPKKVIFTSLLLFLVSLLPLLFMGKTFLPEFDESNLVVVSNSMPGTSLETTSQTGKVMTKHIMEHHEVLAVGQRVGRASGSDDFGSSNFSEIYLRLKEKGVDLDSIADHIREDFSNVPGLIINMGSYISHRMDHVLSGVNAAIAIKLFGPDLETLFAKGKEIETVMKQVNGATDVQMEQTVPVPELTIKINRQNAAQYGLSVGDISKTIETAFSGSKTSEILEGQRSFDLIVWFAPEYRKNIEVIESTLIDTPLGLKVPLGSVASIEFGETPNTIRHENISRHVIIQANVSNRDLGSVINDMKAVINKKVNLPPGYYISYGGQFEAQEKATQQLGIFTVFVIVAIFMLLTMAFKSHWSALLIMVNLPLALIGGIWAILFSGGVMSVGSIVGFITLFGISTRNGIMLVSHFKQLAKEGLDIEDVLKQGSLDRLSPVLMTALTAALGVLPIAIMGGAGRELEQPLAIVIVGGMFTSTALTLLVIPALFKVFYKKALSL